MTAINFQSRFADLVESGAKPHTIRKTNRFKVGDTVQLYTGQGTKLCRKLGEGVVTSVHSFYLDRASSGGDPYLRLSRGSPYIIVATRPICTLIAVYKMDEFAQADGFANADEMADWFEKKYGLPFEGWLIRWRRLNK